LELIDHPEVDRFVAYYTGKARSFVTEGLERRAKYLPIIEPIFESYGVPKELANIAFVESRFITTARSRDGSTVGLWQLSKIVAKNYGLKIGGGVDERTDVKKSSEAAARFLASLYDSFGDWYLAAAAWNLGPSAVQKAVDELQRTEPITSQDLFDLTSRGLVVQITREFVAKVAALAIITKDLEKYGFNQPPRLGGGSVKVSGAEDNG
jgi:membrane-bound lytic murein transglycosylase D